MTHCLRAAFCPNPGRPYDSGTVPCTKGQSGPCQPPLKAAGGRSGLAISRNAKVSIILAVTKNSTLMSPQGRVFIIEHIVPGPDTPHVAKLFDLHMLILLTGRERTLEEYTRLLAGAGWTYRQTWYPASQRLGVVEGVKA